MGFFFFGGGGVWGGGGSRSVEKFAHDPNYSFRVSNIGHLSVFFWLGWVWVGVVGPFLCGAHEVRM